MPPAGREDRLPVNCQGTQTMTSEPKTNMCYPTETINQFLSVSHLWAGCGAVCPGRLAGSPSPAWPAGCTWSRWTKPPESEASAARWGGQPPRGRGCTVVWRRPADSPVCWAEGGCGCGWRGHLEPSGGHQPDAPSQERSRCCRGVWRRLAGQRRRTVWAYWELEVVPPSWTDLYLQPEGEHRHKEHEIKRK